MKLMRILPLLFLFFLLGQFMEAVQIEKLRLATSIYPLQDVVERIAGDEATVFFCVPPGANPHVYEPPPSLVKKLQGIDLFLAIDDHFDGWVSRLLPAKTTLVYLKNEDLGENPHIWLSIDQLRRLAAAIAQRLQLLRPHAKDLFTSNLNRFNTELDRLNKEIASLFAGLKQRSFFLWHPSWNYLAAE